MHEWGNFILLGFLFIYTCLYKDLLCSFPSVRATDLILRIGCQYSRTQIWGTKTSNPVLR